MIQDDALLQTVELLVSRKPAFERELRKKIISLLTSLNLTEAREITSAGASAYFQKIIENLEMPGLLKIGKKLDPLDGAGGFAGQPHRLGREQRPVAGVVAEPGQERREGVRRSQCDDLLGGHVQVSGVGHGLFSTSAVPQVYPAPTKQEAFARSGRGNRPARGAWRRSSVARGPGRAHRHSTGLLAIPRGALLLPRPKPGESRANVVRPLRRSWASASSRPATSRSDPAEGAQGAVPSSAGAGSS